MPPRPIYLDHNATTPVHPDVVEAMLPFLHQEFGNPSSAHPWGRRARAAVDRAREQVASLVGAGSGRIVFTGSGTEASNLAIRGLVTDRSHAVTSTVEHPATVRALERRAAHGWTVSRAPVGADGRLADISALLRPDTALLTVMLANNETGAIMPVAELAAQAHAVGAVVHVDGAQAVGKVPVDVQALGIDLLTVAGHKLYAPKGVGALVVAEGIELQPLVVGGGHEGGLRPGTENVPGIVALGAAAQLAAQDLDSEARRQRSLRDRLWARLQADIEGLVLHGPAGQRLPNTLNVRFPGVIGAELLQRAPQVAASTGSACHEGSYEASAVLLAMGVPAQAALGAVRLSLGRSTTAEQIDQAAAALVRAFRQGAVA